MQSRSSRVRHAVVEKLYKFVFNKIGGRVDLLELTKKVERVCELKGWDKDWLKGGCYIHLEVSEFIESLRGKGDDPPSKEAADVMFTLLAVMDHYKIAITDVLEKLNDICDDHLGL